jgi:uncharacterized protein with PIN domain
MSIKLYMDHHVNRAITDGLRLRGVDVRTAQEDGTQRLPDPELLDCATALGRVLFTQDKDFLREAHRRQNSSEYFAGVIYAHQFDVSIGECVEELELIAKICEPVEWTNRLDHLPLK